MDDNSTSRDWDCFFPPPCSVLLLHSESFEMNVNSGVRREARRDALDASTSRRRGNNSVGWMMVVVGVDGGVEAEDGGVLVLVLGVKVRRRAKAGKPAMPGPKLAGRDGGGVDRGRGGGGGDPRGLDKDLNIVMAC